MTHARMIAAASAARKKGRVETRLFLRSFFDAPVRARSLFRARSVNRTTALRRCPPAASPPGSSRKYNVVARCYYQDGDFAPVPQAPVAVKLRVSTATHEIEELINQLHKLRTQLQNAGDRIQRDIAQYTELSQQTMQLTAIISDSVKKLPTGASNLLH
jgi:hypothetical protein